jgi:hypothetical protein
MAHSFKVIPAKPAFGNFIGTQESGNYIYNKTIRNSFCNPNICIKNPKFGSQSQMLAWRNANNLAKKTIVNSFNKSNLNINLITKLDLEDVCVIKNNLTNDCPTSIVDVTPIYDKYTIDPDGKLFGNTECGINNWRNYLVYNRLK